MKDKLNTLYGRSQYICLNIHSGKTKSMKINQVNENPIFLGEISLQGIESYIYFESNVNTVVRGWRGHTEIVK